VKGYLVDVNHVSAHFNRNQSFHQKYRKIPAETRFCLCAITLGEIQASHEMTVSTNQDRRDKYKEFIIEQYLHNVIPIDASTRIYFADILGRIWRKYPPPKEKRTDRHLIDCGVDMNDVWLAACAFEHGFTILTSDTMTCIRNVVAKEEVKFDCWV
jgi:predicted nucleic acid-binding protein